MVLKRKFRLLILAAAYFCLVITPLVTAAQPIVSEVMVTDVTRQSFCLVWSSSEPSTGTLTIYSDINGLNDVTNTFTIISHPTQSDDLGIKTNAEDYGIMKVMAVGAKSNTNYYVQTITTSKSTGGVTYYPNTAPFIQFTTMVRTRKRMIGAQTSITNDSIIMECYLNDAITPVETGMLMIAKVEGTAYPISAFIGDGIASPYGLVNLNNTYDFANKENVDLPGGWQLDIALMKGIEPTSTAEYTVPQDRGLAEVRFPTGRGDLNGDGSVNVIDVQDCVNGFLGTRPYTDSADLNDDSFINVIDVQAVVNIFLGI